MMTTQKFKDAHKKFILKCCNSMKDQNVPIMFVYVSISCYPLACVTLVTAFIRKLSILFLYVRFITTMHSI